MQSRSPQGRAIRVVFVLTACLLGCGNANPTLTAAADTGTAADAQGGPTDATADSKAPAADATGAPQVIVPTGPVKLDDLDNAIAAAHCHRLVDCDAPVAGYTVALAAHCPSFLAGFSFYDPSRQVAMVKAGTVTYDPALGGACVAALADCSQPGGKAQACPAMFAGTIDAGKACSHGLACKSGACGPTPGGAPCAGTCAAEAKAGEPCNGSQPCAAGLSCNGTCNAPLAPAKQGEDCAGKGCEGQLICVSSANGLTCQAAGAVGAECGSGHGCQQGLFCSKQNPTYGKCRALGKPGEVCEHQNELTTCTTGVCGVIFAPGSDKPTFRCLPWGKAGEPCEAMNQCKGTMDAVCKAGTCTLRGEVGAACAPTEELMASECLFDLLCSATTKTCAPFPGVGEACTQSCNKDLYCSDASKTCVAYPGLGGGCTASGMCAGGLLCTGGKCAKAGCD